MILRRLVPLLALLAAAGCGTTVAGSPGPQVGIAPSAGAAAAAAAAAGAAGASTDGAPVDACSLLKADEVEALIGKNGGPKGSPGARSSCVWETEASLSVSVDIGAPGTAVNGLPAWDTSIGPEQVLPGGMREINGGVEFAASGRDCLVQVVADPGSKEDVDRGVALSKVVASRL